MDKEKLIIIGANEFQLELVQKAKTLGYETHIFAWEEGAIAKTEADFFYPISITDKEKILEFAKKIKPVGIVSIASDLAVPTVNYVANALNLTANSNHSSLISTNKFEMRKVFENNKLPSPKFKLVDQSTDLEKLDFVYPVIVKPIDRSGSRGICKVESFSELKNAIKNAINVSFTDKILVEEYAEGQEYSMEMISYKGEHHFLALTKKYTTGAPNFIETAHIQPAPFDKKLKLEVINIIKKALDALQIKNGASHSEFKVDKNGKIRIIEIGARMGGDCIGSDLVEISTGNDFKKMVIDIAVGKKLKFANKDYKQKTAYTRFIFSKDDLEVLKNIKANYPDKIYRIGDIKNEQQITSDVVMDSSTRFGYFILKCDSNEECFKIIKNK